MCHAGMQDFGLQPRPKRPSFGNVTRRTVQLVANHFPGTCKLQQAPTSPFCTSCLLKEMMWHFNIFYDACPSFNLHLAKCELCCVARHFTMMLQLHPCAACKQVRQKDRHHHLRLVSREGLLVHLPRGTHHETWMKET